VREPPLVDSKDVHSAAVHACAQVAGDADQTSSSPRKRSLEGVNLHAHQHCESPRKTHKRSPQELNPMELHAARQGAGDAEAPPSSPTKRSRDNANLGTHLHSGSPWKRRRHAQAGDLSLGAASMDAPASDLSSLACGLPSPAGAECHGLVITEVSSTGTDEGGEHCVEMVWVRS
jgi:hypothetical protein